MSSYTPGRSQIAIMRMVSGGKWFRAETAQQYNSGLRSSGWGFLSRHPRDSRMFSSTDRGEAWLDSYDQREAAA